MKQLLIIFLALFTYFTGQSQTNQFTKSEDSDPAAKAVLEKVRNKYEALESVEASFSLTIELPEEPTEVQEGKLVQKGDKYRLALESHVVFCDGETLWLVLKNNKEVQINNVEEDEEEELLSPKSLLTIYEQEDYTYVLINEQPEEGRVVQQIEFKPLDRDSEYSKMRLTIDKKSSEIKRIKVFSKDGSRYTLEMNSLVPNKTYNKEYFVFDASDYPGFHVEDLRID